MKKVIFILPLAYMLTACSKQDISNKPDTLKYMEVFKSESPFYDSIPANAEIDPNSDAMVQSLLEQLDQAFQVVVKEWSVPVYFADQNTPLSDVKMTASWAPQKSLTNVPIPDYAEPDPESDGHLVVIDEDGGCVYDFWEMRYSLGKWKAGWGNAIPLESDGIFPKGLSARGSGFELLQGLIWPQELESGEINHALIFSFDNTRSGGFVSPATESDGTSDGVENIPEGALVQLNPDLNLNSLGLNNYEYTIALALQKYGMYCADDGGGISLYAINPICVSINPYKDIWGDKTYVDMSKIPVNEFRVLKLPAQNNSEAELVANSCAEFN